MDSTAIAVGATPVVSLRCGASRRGVEVLLKLEQSNPMGSIKDRTAQGLVDDLLARGVLVPGTRVVESTSGNLGLALAARLRTLGYGFIAVIDPKTPAGTVAGLLAEGAEIDLVDVADDAGGYLLNRLRRVQQIISANPDVVWTDQYRNPANPAVHTATTGPEIVAQSGPGLEAVYVAVSTGGTLAGIADHLRTWGHPARLVAVDLVFSSVVARPESTRRPMRLIPGIGGSRRSSFLEPWMYDAVHRIPDAEGIALGRILREDTGLLVGGSSGCVLAALWRDLRVGAVSRRALALCADGGERYLDSLYDDGWLAAHGVADQVDRTQAGLRACGVAFGPAGA